MSDQLALKRETFKTSRLLEFFTEKELNMQLGHSKEYWLISILKELIDNSLDACEIAKVIPDIVVNVEKDKFSVSDNGNGIPEVLIKKSLDFTIRVSDKTYYISPTRGQLGNALKTVYAVPFVENGISGLVEIETRGRRYSINVSLDRIAQAPIMNLVKGKSDCNKGVKITVYTPNSATLIEPIKVDDFYKLASESIVKAEDLILAYSVFNPHAAFTYNGKKFDKSVDTWDKWNPNNPTSAYWYNQDQLRDLIAAYVANGSDKTVREFVSEFRGLQGTQKQKLITNKLWGTRLSELVKDGDLDITKIGDLLREMQSQSKPVNPKLLGSIGEEHLKATMGKYYEVLPESIRYKKICRVDEKTNLPHLIEIGFGGFKDDSKTRLIITGLNWSPTIGIPLPEIQQMLGEMRINRDDPVCLIIHIARPKFEFVDRGKGALDV